MKPLDRTLQQIRGRMVRPYVTTRTRLLDIGCADGALFRQLGPIATYVGVDPEAPEAPAGPNARFIHDSFPTQALDPDERFDVIAMTAVLEHVPVRAQPEFARACARHATPGCHLVVTVPSPAVDTILHMLKRVSVADGMRDDQHYGFDPRATPSVFEPAGFRLERHRRFELGLNHLFVFRARQS